jgi:Na+/alanine symporter
MSTLTRASVVGVVASVVRWLGLVFALVLAVHVLLTLGNANPANGITTFFSTTADWFVLAFKSLFTPDDAKLRVLVNYGLAAVFWMIVSAVLSRLVRRLA